MYDFEVITDANELEMHEYMLSTLPVPMFISEKQDEYAKDQAQ